MFNSVQRWTSALLTVVTFRITDASAVHAQQCPPGSNVVIDPGLVPRPPRITPDMIRTLPYSGWSAEEQARVRQQYYEQFQPIKMPYRNGYVLIDPKDLCHQQFVPLH
jgi:hypothetical protein